jgi:single-strand DNA-binding protein
MTTMMQRNRLEVIGFLATKPVARFLPSGTPVANVRLGESYRFQDGEGKPQQHTNWHNLSFYGDLSRIATTFEKGDNIFVEGTIEQRQFTPKGDGVQRTVQEVVVRNCHLIAALRGTTTKAAAVATTDESAIAESQKGATPDDDWPV